MKPSGVGPAHCRSSTTITTGRAGEATARSRSRQAWNSRCSTSCGSPAGTAPGRPQQQRELRQHRGDAARRSGRARAGSAPAASASSCLRLGQQQAAKRAQRLRTASDDGVVAVLVELAGHEPAAAAVTIGRSSSISAVLPTPARRRSAAPRSRPCSASSKAVCSDGDLRVPADQSRRRGQAQREVVLAQRDRSVSPRCRPRAAGRGRAPAPRRSGSAGRAPSPAGA